jgi:hypothetical protein
MPLDFPSSPNTNDTYTDDNSAVWQYDGVKWNVITGVTKTAFSGVKAVLDADFTLTATSTAIPFDTEEFDTESYFTLTSDTRFTISRNGFYRINAHITPGTAGSGSSYTIKIKKNGTTDLATVSAAPNQEVIFDETIELAQNDYIEVFADESTASGTIESDTTFFELYRTGLALASEISHWESFSGVRANLDSAVATNTTSTALSWDSVDFNQNADVLGTNYWAAGTPTRITVKVTGYYRTYSFIATNSQGSDSSYTIILKKNGSTNLETATLNASNEAQLDEIYYLTANDYLELFVDNSDNTGQILDTAYLEVVRLGV